MVFFYRVTALIVVAPTFKLPSLSKRSEFCTGKTETVVTDELKIARKVHKDSGFHTEPQLLEPNSSETDVNEYYFSQKPRQCTEEKARCGEMISNSCGCSHLCPGRLERQPNQLDTVLLLSAEQVEPITQLSIDVCSGVRTYDCFSSDWQDLHPSFGDSLLHGLQYSREQVECDPRTPSTPTENQTTAMEQHLQDHEHHRPSAYSTPESNSDLLPTHEEEFVSGRPYVPFWPGTRRQENCHNRPRIMHTYTRPFVCNMPALQPPFVGEQTT